MRIAIIAAVGLALAGCGGKPVLPADLQPPHPDLMQPPAPLPPIPTNERATLGVVTVNNAAVRGVCVGDQRRLVDLQTYVRTLTSKGG